MNKELLGGKKIIYEEDWIQTRGVKREELESVVKNYKNECKDGKIPVQVCSSRYDQMMEDLFFLSCLQEAGFDNWAGYDDACKAFKERYPDE